MTLPVVETAMDDLRLAHRELLRAVDSLSEAEWDRYIPYGHWTIKDLVSHCVGDMSPSGVGLILAGVLTPKFIADTSRIFDVRARNAAVVEERQEFSREDLRQMLFSCHDAMYTAALKLREEHLPVLEYEVPMGPDHTIQVLDWLWFGYHDRQHTDDIKRALEMDWRPEDLAFLPEIEGKFRLMTRYHEGLLRAVYSVDDSAWDEESPNPGWTYRDLLAHVASNYRRHQIRILNVLREADRADVDSLPDVSGWNEREVAARRDDTVHELLEEMDSLRHETFQLLARLRPEHLTAQIHVNEELTCTPAEYIEVFSAHESRHAAQFVPVSRARRWDRK